MRDSQRSKVYRAESLAFGPSGWRGPAVGLETTADVEAYLEKLIARAWFRRRWPYFGDCPEIRPGHDAVGQLMEDDLLSLTLPRWARVEEVILHELAHCIVARTVTGPKAAHGWQFTSTLLELIRYGVGPEKHRALREAFKDQGVKYKKPRELSPAQRAALAERMRKLNNKCS